LKFIIAPHFLCCCMFVRRVTGEMADDSGQCRLQVAASRGRCIEFRVELHVQKILCFEKRE